MSDAPLLIVIPCLNEAAHLRALIGTLTADPGAANARIVIADGGSTDGSQAIVTAAAEADPRVVLLQNPKKIQSAGVNAAVAAFGDTANFFVRIDAHAGYPAQFIASLLTAQAETGADSVTVAMQAKAHTGGCFQIANAAAQNSALGAGGSPHRNAGVRRFTDHGHHALMRTAAFRAVGGYDESFSHNEDAELDHRLIGNGARILLAGDIVVDYYPRATLRGLWRQYYMFGRGRAKTVAKHRIPLKPRQLAPALIAPSALLALAAPLWPPAAAPFALYLALCLGLGALLGFRQGSVCAGAAGAPAATMHLAWSCGFWRQVLAAGAAHWRKALQRQ